MLIRKAVFGDIPLLEILIPESVRALQAPDYDQQQIEGALGTIFGVDRQLIRDGTYFVVEVDLKVVACGGWSRRKTLFGSDQAPQKDDACLDPLTEPGRIRAFFVHPAWARHGIGSLIVRACENAAFGEGFLRLELVATLTGEPFYRTHGFTAVEHFEIPLPNGAKLPVARMIKDIDKATAPNPIDERA